MSRNRTLIYIIGAVVVIGGLALAWWLASPLFLNRTVDEDFPLEVPSEEEIAAMPEGEREALEAEVLATAAMMPDKEMDEPMPEAEAEPIVLLQGEFMDADNFHMGSGTATIYALPDGTGLLRFEGFEVTNGPDLHVILSSSAAPTSQEEVMTDGSADLGPIKGNVGDQNYEIPTSVDLSSIQSVVIYCQPFHVIFATASLN